MITGSTAGDAAPQWTYHLHRNLGPVIDGRRTAAGWTGVVGAEAATWGEIKALYAR
ncbi:MAG: hypothetical protein IPM94_01095 [bacterium]|nr:hypothetical protein [bacterium]